MQGRHPQAAEFPARPHVEPAPAVAHLTEDLNQLRSVRYTHPHAAATFQPDLQNRNERSRQTSNDASRSMYPAPADSRSPCSSDGELHNAPHTQCVRLPRRFVCTIRLRVDAVVVAELLLSQSPSPSLLSPHGIIAVLSKEDCLTQRWICTNPCSEPSNDTFTFVSWGQHGVQRFSPALPPSSPWRTSSSSIRRSFQRRECQSLQ